ncbi:hypothetical protein AMTR_s00033p00242990 [Amborella trichopoda]|uniref:RPW8 domain-containing protein n=1 Tax=Amborella trichopoda TaxID=13333 RepID=U5CWA7_AMBTC|nr:hypothetical protein AMTR_s00033p00242990 [Amborella trichopoda]
MRYDMQCQQSLQFPLLGVELMSMDLFSGAAIGAIAGELLRALLDAKNMVKDCKSHCEKLKSTLQHLIPKLKAIDQLRLQLTDSQPADFVELKSQLESGMVLVHKCTKLQFWELFKIYRCAKQLIQLDEYLVRFFNLNLAADTNLDTKYIRTNTKDLIRLFAGRLGIASESSCALPGLPDLPVGLSDSLRELKAKFFSDEMSVLGLCAQGGYGKTTLASMFCREEDVKGRFKNNIFFFIVSNSPDVLSILSGLYEQLTSRKPDFRNVEDARRQLLYILTKKEPEPILVVLDDVWSDTVLEDLLFNKTKGCKTLVTSRNVLRSFDSKYELGLLKDKDAMSLFRHSAFSNITNPQRIDEDLVWKIVKYCKGLPLALKVIGHSLRYEPAQKWKITECKLSKGSSIFASHEELLHCLSTSLTPLNKPLKDCFLDLGSFPEDKRIPAASLIDMWVELRGMDEDEAYVALLELSRRTLISLVENTRKEAGEDDGSFSGLFVIQHDLLRELAIHVNHDSNINQKKRLVMEKREGCLPESWIEHKDQPFDAQIVSIYTSNMSESDGYDMRFPRTEALILNFSSANYCIPQFIKTMENLKFLSITNHDTCLAKVTGLSPLESLPHLKRIRLERIIIPSFHMNMQPLKSLQKLCLLFCELNQSMSCSDPNVSNQFSELKENAMDYERTKSPVSKDIQMDCKPLKSPESKEIEMDYISTIFPKLKEIEMDYFGDLRDFPSWVCNITHLNKLSITNCHELCKLPEEVGGLKYLEVLNLHACTRLSELPRSITRLSNLKLLDISQCLSIVRLPNALHGLSVLEKINMSRCSQIRRLPGSVAELRGLKKVICDEEIANQWEMIELQSLRGLQVHVVEEEASLDWLEM